MTCLSPAELNRWLCCCIWPVALSHSRFLPSSFANFHVLACVSGLALLTLHLSRLSFTSGHKMGALLVRASAWCHSVIVLLKYLLEIEEHIFWNPVFPQRKGGNETVLLFEWVVMDACACVSYMFQSSQLPFPKCLSFMLQACALEQDNTHPLFKT